MGPRARRGVGALGVVVFAAFYIWLAITVGDFVPDLWWAKVIYFAVVGTAWAIPLKPLILWAEGGRPKGE
jgi:hypothetical protein